MNNNDTLQQQQPALWTSQGVNSQTVILRAWCCRYVTCLMLCNDLSRSVWCKWVTRRWHPKSLLFASTLVIIAAARSYPRSHRSDRLLFYCLTHRMGYQKRLKFGSMCYYVNINPVLVGVVIFSFCVCFIMHQCGGTLAWNLWHEKCMCKCM